MWRPSARWLSGSTSPSTPLPDAASGEVVPGPLPFARRWPLLGLRRSSFILSGMEFAGRQSLRGRFSRTIQGTRAPSTSPKRQVSAYIQAGMSDGLQTAGLQHDRIEFAEGLKVAFEMADAGDRWLRGQRLFAAAVL